jgi:hypothetical protein
MTVPDAAEKYLTLAKKTKTTYDIAEALLNGGLKSASKNFSSMVNTVLARDDRFVKVNGQWGLNAWYPGMRRGQRATTVASADSTATTKPGPAATPAKKQPSTGNGHVVEFAPDSLKGQVISTLDSSPDKLFDGPELAHLLQKHIPSIRAALCKLFSDGLIAKPENGKYQSIKRHHA